MFVNREDKILETPLSIITTFKGITSRIRWLLFVNATFKAGPSSTAQSARASRGPTSPAPHTLRAVTGWGLHTTAQRLMPRNVPNTANMKIEAEGRVSTDTDTTTHF